MFRRISGLAASTIHFTPVREDAGTILCGNAVGAVGDAGPLKSGAGRRMLFHRNSMPALAASLIAKPCRDGRTHHVASGIDGSSIISSASFQRSFAEELDAVVVGIVRR